jgi:hypothetical protein
MNLKYRLVILAILTFGVGYISWATLQTHVVGLKHSEKKKLSSLPRISYNNNLLLRFQQLCQAIDPSTDNYEMQAKLMVVDGADSVSSHKYIDYLVGKNGTDFYCKMENNEIINTDRFCLFIDHVTKVVLVKPAQPIPKLKIVPNLKGLLKTLSSERYELREGAEGGQNFIKLINEQHISCKEYKIGYDKESMKPSSFYLRFTNIDSPEDSTKDKEIFLEKLTVKANFNMSEMLRIAGVKNVNGNILLEDSYPNYRIIKM